MYPKAISAGLAVLYCLTVLAFKCEAQTPAESGRTTEWKRYDLSQGSFSVFLPGSPVEMDLASDPAVTLPIEYYVYSLATEQAVFITMRILIKDAAERWSEKGSNAFYDGFWASMAAGQDKEMEAQKLPHRTKLLERRKSSLSGYEGQEFIFTTGLLQGRVLITRIGRHSFVAGVLRSETKPAADVDKYFTSFVINQSWLSEHKPPK